MINTRTNHLQSLNNDQLTQLAVRWWDRTHDIMNSLGANALVFGWDWPTFAVLHPARAQVWRRIQAEGQARGLASKK